MRGSANASPFRKNQPKLLDMRRRIDEVEGEESEEELNLRRHRRFGSNFHIKTHRLKDDLRHAGEEGF